MMIKITAELTQLQAWQRNPKKIDKIPLELLREQTEK